MSADRETPSYQEELRRAYREEQDGQAQTKPTPPRDWQSVIEEQIAKIDVDVLAGKGKPLNLATNPYLDPSEALAQDLLKNAGFTLPWIDDAKHIDARLDAARRKLLRAWDETAGRGAAPVRTDAPQVESGWQTALREFRREVEQINREIRDYNLKAPSMSVHKFSIRIDEELARFGVQDAHQSHP